MTLQQMKDKRAQVLSAAEALKGADGTFKDDATRADFDAKMAEITQLDAKIREAEAPTPTDEQARAVQTAQLAERKRVTDIRAAVSVATRNGLTLPATFEAEQVANGKTIEEVRGEIFRLWAAKSDENPTRSHVATIADAADKWMRGATNWLLVKAGQAELVARHAKVDVSTLSPGEFRGLSLLDLARQVLERAGRDTRGMDKMRMVGEAFTCRVAGMITQSTSDFAVLLENVLHKVLQAAYATQPDTWSRFCAQSTVVDFRAHNRYRMGTFGGLDPLNESGEFKNKAITDAEKATITATTKGNIINVSRAMIVNDDMNAFSRLATMLGRAGKLAIELDVFALLAQNSGDGPTMPYDSTALFHANHGNKTTGAALSAAALDLDRVAMAKQKDKDSNDYIDLRPAILLLDVTLGGQARVINQSQYDPDNIASGSKATMKPNLVAGLFRDVVDSPRVGAISTTRRYLFSDPAIAPVLEVAFLEGQTEPILETQNGWRADGAEMRARLDYGVAGVDHRGAVTNAGV